MPLLLPPILQLLLLQQQQAQSLEEHPQCNVLLLAHLLHNGVALDCLQVGNEAHLQQSTRTASQLQLSQNCQLRSTTTWQKAFTFTYSASIPLLQDCLQVCHGVVA